MFRRSRAVEDGDTAVKGADRDSADFDPADAEAAIKTIRAQARRQRYRVTQHAQQEMVEEGIHLDHVLQAIRCGEILENYPGHRRGACCLVFGYTREGEPLHVVCTTAQPLLIIITVYRPKPPKWLTPNQRRPKS